MASIFSRTPRSLLIVGRPLKDGGFIPHKQSYRQLSSLWVCHECCDRKSTPARTLQRPALNTEVRRARLYSSQPQQHDTRDSRDDSTSSKALPSQAERGRSDIAKRLSIVMDHLQSNIFVAGQRLNDLTGYSGIEALKKEIEEQELKVQSARQRQQETKQSYSNAIAQRSGSQREVNELLQRKNSWSPQDLERFTALYRSDHANEQSESTAKEAMEAAEKEVEEASAKLGARILARYHEEQIWSDKIRRMSTWGTWGLMGVNVLLFLIFQIGVEPWRRKRLVKGFEDKVVEALEREGIASNVAIAALQKAQEPVVPAPELTLEVEDTDGTVMVVSEGDGAVEVGNVSSLGACKEYIEDLFSSRAVQIRKVDLTAAALEGAFVGITLAAIVTSIVRT